MDLDLDMYPCTPAQPLDIKASKDLRPWASDGWETVPVPFRCASFILLVGLAGVAVVAFYAWMQEMASRPLLMVPDPAALYAVGRWLQGFFSPPSPAVDIRSIVKTAAHEASGHATELLKEIMLGSNLTEVAEYMRSVESLESLDHGIVEGTGKGVRRPATADWVACRAVSPPRPIVDSLMVLAVAIMFALAVAPTLQHVYTAVRRSGRQEVPGRDTADTSGPSS
ncbi:g9805 [Coccomyxa viridis]|uniref:G9805 protein n=1 Tax=Coccomyxa viridis TaxID=1274662 RepID=A0ABP1G570_9CHLO